MTTTQTETRAQLASVSPFMLMLEYRALFGLGAYISTQPLLNLATPRGDGHPVLILPGLTASDHSTKLMRDFLKQKGYRAHKWKLGVNFGMNNQLKVGIKDRLEELYERYQQPVSLIGWSLGGIYARELARRHPEMVRQLITLAAPFRSIVEHSHAAWIYELLTGKSAHVAQVHEIAKILTPPPVPTTAMYSKSDGVVPWQHCMESEGHGIQNIEVSGSHSGLGHNPAVFFTIANRLALKKGEWEPFRASHFERLWHFT
ncbi:MAG: alpha/beta hydrolase [Bacteroidota bacterium]